MMRQGLAPCGAISECGPASALASEPALDLLALPQPCERVDLFVSRGPGGCGLELTSPRSRAAPEPAASQPAGPLPPDSSLAARASQAPEARPGLVALGRAAVALHVDCLQLRSLACVGVPLGAVMDSLLMHHRLLLQWVPAHVSQLGWAEVPPRASELLLRASSEAIASLADTHCVGEAVDAFWRTWTGCLSMSPQAVRSLFTALGRAGRVDTALRIARQLAMLPCDNTFSDALRALLPALARDSQSDGLERVYRRLTLWKMLNAAIQPVLVEAVVTAEARSLATELLMDCSLHRLTIPLGPAQRRQLGSLVGVVRELG